MTTTLSVIVDPILWPATGGIGRYTEELTRELINTAPAGCEVAAISSATPAEGREQIKTLLPGIARLTPSRLPHAAQSLAWQYGLGGIAGRGVELAGTA